MHQRRLLISVLSAFVFASLVFGGSVSAQTLSPESLLDQGYNQFWDGRYDRAESTFRTLTERFPDSSIYWDARYGLARSLRKQGELESAARHFRSVRRNHPEKSVRGDALFGQVEVAILQDRTIRAERLLRTFLDVFPDHVLEPTAREQLELLRGIDRSESPTFSREPESRSESTDQPRQPRLKPSGEGETSPRNLIQPGSSGDTDSGTSSARPEMRQDASDETSPRTGRDTSPRISPLGSTGPDTPEQKDTEPTPMPSSQRGDEPTRADTAGGPGGSSGSGGLITPQELGRTSGQTGDTSSGGNSSSGSARMATAPSGDTDGLSGDTGVDAGSSADSEADTKPVASGSDETKQSEETGRTDSEKAKGPSLQRVRKLMRQGSLNEARTLIDTVLDSGEPGPEAYALAARLYDREPARPDRVLEYVDRALRLSPDPPSAYHLLKTEALLASDRVQEALASLKELNPESLGESETGARYHYLRGTIALRLDQTDNAFFHFMDAVRSAPSSRWAKQSQQTIKNRL